LVIEDDPGVASSLKKELEAAGYEAAMALRGDDGLAAARQTSFDVVITALKVPGLSGLDLVDQLHAAMPKLPIILMTAYGTAETAIAAARLGACEYLLKPFEMTELLGLVAKALASVRPASGLLEPGMGDSNPLGMVGRSRAMQTLYKEIGQAGQVSMNVLIRGETGTGKELVARAIHQHSSRAAQPFVAVNCTAIPETLVESEYSATNGAPLPAPMPAASGASRRPAEALCSSTKLATSPRARRPSCCGCFRKSAFSGWAGTN
jgi:DNA-binding NtrC family response regulator